MINLKEQNASIQKVNDTALRLETDRELDRNIVKEINETVRLLEENVAAHAYSLQNYSSHLDMLDLEMTMITEKIQFQNNIQEQLKENMATYAIDSNTFNTRLNDLEARTNASVNSSVDHDNRIGQLELSHLSEFTLNEEQTSQIYGLEEEMNKTWSAIQVFVEGPKDPVGKGEAGNFQWRLSVMSIDLRYVSTLSERYARANTVNPEQTCPSRSDLFGLAVYTYMILKYMYTSCTLHAKPFKRAFIHDQQLFHM